MTSRKPRPATTPSTPPPMKERTNSIALSPTVRQASRYDDPEQDGVEHDRRGVVEERLALDEPRQPGRRPDVAEHRDHRGRVGRRDHRPEQAGRRRAEPRENGQSASPTMKAVMTVAMTASIRIGAASSRMRRTSVVNDASKIEQRQEDVNERLGAERQFGERLGDLAEPGRQTRCAPERPKPRRSPHRSQPGERPAPASVAQRAAG